MADPWDVDSPKAPPDPPAGAGVDPWAAMSIDGTPGAVDAVDAAATLATYAQSVPFVQQLSQPAGARTTLRLATPFHRR